MAQRGPSRGTGKRVSGSVITGLLLVPATAIAAVAIVGATTRPSAAEALEETTTTTEEIAEETTTTTIVDIEGLSDEEALREACTESAEELLEREFDESISDVETAALDALRQICEEHGLPIAGPPEPEAIVQVITVKETPQDAVAVDVVASDDHDDDDYDDHDDHDDDEEGDDDHDDEDEEDDDDHHEDEEDKKDED
jgi:hypothetical protein